MIDLSENVSISVEKLDELSDALVVQKEIGKQLEDLKSNQITEEEFEGKVTDLVKLQLEENRKAMKAAADRKISFAAGQITNDPCRIGIEKAMKAEKPGDRRKLFGEAMASKTDDAELKALQEINDDLLITDLIMRSGLSRDEYKANGAAA